MSEPKKREELDAVIKQARIILLKSLNLPTTLEDEDVKLQDVTPPFKEQLRAKSKEMLKAAEQWRKEFGVDNLIQ